MSLYLFAFVKAGRERERKEERKKKDEIQEEDGDE